MPLVGSKRVAGGQTQSSSGSGVFFQGDVYQQGQINSNLSSSFGNSANSVSGKGCSNLYPANGDMSRTGLNSASNSGPSVGASSMVTDANSALSGGPQLQRSASFNAESYMRMPASPMSFSSNNISLSGNSLLDGSSIVQQSSHQDQNSQQGQTRHGASTASSRIGQGLGPNGKQVPYSSNQEAQYISQMQKKQRLDIKDDILQQQARLQRQNSLYLQGYNPQMQTLIQQQRHLPRQQLPQQMLQSVPQMQRAQMQQQMQNDQLRQQYQQSLQPLSGLKRQYETGACGRRIMQYLYHQRQRPDNSFAYWKKFTEAYFAPRAKKRWCLSLYDNVGQHALGVFPQATMDAWHCEICGSKSGRGFEASYEVLPRLFKVKFDSGVKDELLYLDLPREGQLSSGLFILEYGKAVQESVYEHLRVTREGRLRVMFSPEMKILSWEFCARRHEELLPRRFIAPQVNQLLQVAQKYQNAVTESGSDGVSTQDLQENWNRFLTAGRQLARSMELPLLNDLGFSKRYVRCLQISEVVNSMNDLMDFSKENKIGPIESLKNYPQQGKFSMQNMQVGQQGGAGGLSGDRNPLNNIMSVNPSLGGQMSINNHMVGRGGYPNTPTQTTLSGYQNFLRQNSISSNPNAPQQEGSFVNNPSLCGTVSSTQSTMQNGPANGMTNPHFHHQKQQEPQAVNGDPEPQPTNPESSAGNQSAQSDMIQQLFHEMMGNNGEVSEQQQQQQQQQQQSLGGQNANGSIGEETSVPPNAVTDGGLPAKTSATDGGSTVGTGDNGVNNALGDAAAKEAPEGSSNDKTSASITADDNYGLDFSDVLNFPEIDCDISNAFPEWDL